MTTDRQTNSLTPYTGVCRFFLSVKFATSLLASLAGGLTSPTLSKVIYFDQLLLAVGKVHVVYFDHQLGAAHYTLYI